MARTEQADSPTRRKESLILADWLVLRACSRLRSPALTSHIAREVQEEQLLDPRHVQVTLQRLRDRGYLSMQKESAKRSVWSLAVGYEDVLREEIRFFVERSLGADGKHIGLFYEVLAEAEAELSKGKGDRLSRGLRKRLSESVGLVLERKRLRARLAEVLDVKLAVLDGLAVSAQTVLLIKAAGGYNREAALRVVEAVEGLQEELGRDVERALERVRGELGGGG